jgi:hypothetical protein
LKPFDFKLCHAANRASPSIHVPRVAMRRLLPLLLDAAE